LFESAVDRATKRNLIIGFLILQGMVLLVVNFSNAFSNPIETWHRLAAWFEFSGWKPGTIQTPLSTRPFDWSRASGSVQSSGSVSWILFREPVKSSPDRWVSTSPREAHSALVLTCQ
jgi:hypothetical protein